MENKTSKNSIETWKDIPGYNGLYQVSNHGRIKRLSRITLRKGFPTRLPETIQKLKIQTNGYLSIGLTIDNNRKTINVHRLVAIAFIDNTNQKSVVNHIDGNKQNNYVDNLEWCSFSDNSQHAKSKGLKKDVFGEAHGMTSLTENDVKNIRNLAQKGIKGIFIAKNYPSVSYATIQNIITRKTWVKTQ